MINDFPAYANLSGYSIKGKKTCLVCGVNTDLTWLSCSHKNSYMGHRQFLAYNHPWRYKKSWFDGSVESRWMPRPVTGGDAWRAIMSIENKWGKVVKKPREKNLKREVDQRDRDKQNRRRKHRHGRRGQCFLSYPIGM